MSQLPPPARFFEHSFDVSPELMRQVMTRALSRGGDHCELFFQHRRQTSVGVEDGAVNRASASIDLGVGIRVLKGDQTGYAFTERLAREELLEAASVAAAIADGPARSAPLAFDLRALDDRYPVRTWWHDVEIDQRVRLLAALEEATASWDARVKKVRASLADAETHILIADSSGRLSADRQPMVVLRLSCSVEQGGQVEENFESFAARAGLEALTPAMREALVRVCVERALRAFEAIKPSGGEQPVVLAAGDAGILLHEAVGHGMEADFNRKGTSVYADAVGQSIAAPFVSIVDDGTVAGSRGAINFDDEGTPGQRTVLVEDGVLRGYLHDRISAAHYGVALTGNGRRQSFRSAPLPRMRNTYMLAGPHTRDEVIAAVERGVLCESFTNGQVNIGPGDFTFYVKTGYLIEHGRVTAPVKDFNIIGNGPEVLRRVTMLADDLELDDSSWSCGKDGQSVPVSLGMPTCLVSSITVGGVG